MPAAAGCVRREAQGWQRERPAVRAVPQEAALQSVYGCRLRRRPQAQLPAPIEFAFQGSIPVYDVGQLALESEPCPKRLRQVSRGIELASPRWVRAALFGNRKIAASCSAVRMGWRINHLQCPPRRRASRTPGAGPCGGRRNGPAGPSTGISLGARHPELGDLLARPRRARSVSSLRW